MIRLKELLNSGDINKRNLLVSWYCHCLAWPKETSSGGSDGEDHAHDDDSVTEDSFSEKDEDEDDNEIASEGTPESCGGCDGEDHAHDDGSAKEDSSSKNENEDEDVFIRTYAGKAKKAKRVIFESGSESD